MGGIEIIKQNQKKKQKIKGNRQKPVEKALKNKDEKLNKTKSM